MLIFACTQKGTGLLQGFKAELFKALGHPVRIRILELLRGGERTVTDLQVQLQIIGPSVSQQLAVLRGKQLVTSRKEGTNVYYRVTDPRVYDLLDTARAIFESHVASLQTMMEGADAALAHDATGDTAR